MIVPNATELHGVKWLKQEIVTYVSTRTHTSNAKRRETRRAVGREATRERLVNSNHSDNLPKSQSSKKINDVNYEVEPHETVEQGQFGSI